MKRFVFAAENGGSTVYDVSTNVIPIIDVDAYGGTLSAFFYDTDSVIPEDSLDDFWNQVVNESMDIIQDCFNEYYIPAEVVPGSGSIYHPREYNFSGDELNFSISVKDDWVQEKFETYRDDSVFLNFINKKYASRDGFISFFPSDSQEFVAAFESRSDRWKVVCEIITYQFGRGVYEENSEELLDRLFANPDFEILYLDSSPSGEHSGMVEELIEDYRRNPDDWDDSDAAWLREYAKYEDVPFE